MTTLLGLSDDDGKMLIADTLRMFVGQGRRFSWADLEKATGDDERKLRSYVERDPPAMPGPVMMRVFAVLPPEAWARVNFRMGFSPPAPAEVDDGSSVRGALAAAARLVADGNEYLADGVLTPVERAALADRAMETMPALRMIAGGKS